MLGNLLSSDQEELWPDYRSVKHTTDEKMIDMSEKHKLQEKKTTYGIGIHDRIQSY